MNCYKATQLMSQARERPLNLREKLALQLHKAMCAGCRHFDQHLGFLQRAGRHYAQSEVEETKPEEPDKPATDDKG